MGFLYYRGGSFVGSMQYDYEDKVPGSSDDLGTRIERIDYCCNPSHSISYTYDNVGNVQTMDVGGGYDWTYGYDKTYQVTWADQGSATNRMVDWQYDSVYNRTYWSDTALGSLTYSDNAMNQYTGINGTTPAYDSRGNLRSYHGSYYMAYDCENRLVMAGLIAYGYDLLGRRNCRTYAPYSEQTYVWDGAHIIAEYTNGSLTKKYIYGPGIDNPVAMINVDAYGNETWYYYYADAQGSVRLISNAAGEIVEGYAYDPFGRPRVMVSEGPDGNWLTEDVQTYNSSSIGNPYMFTGRRWDHMTGIYYYRFRDYDSKLGRFLQPDPAGYIDTMNLYAYCTNNPVNWIDPWGLCQKGMTEAEEAAFFNDLAADLGLTVDEIAKFAHKSQGTGKFTGAKKDSHQKGERRDNVPEKKKLKPGWKPNKIDEAVAVGAGTVVVCYIAGFLADCGTAGPSFVETGIYGSALVGIAAGSGSSETYVEYD